MYSSRPDRRPLDAGLTLVELLVAVMLSTILLGSLYYVYSVSSRSYRIQGQVLRAMDQTRFGLDMIRRDLSAAAFLATPNSNADGNVCSPKPSPTLHGIAFGRCSPANDTCVANKDVNLRIEPHDLTLFGAYWSASVFYTESIIGNVVTLQTTTPSPFPSAAEFAATFPAGRYLHIVTAEQYEMYALIAGSAYDPTNGVPTPTITLQNALPTASPPNYCGVEGFGVGLEVNAAGYIRYRLMADQRAGAPPGKVDLVRQELAADLAQTVTATMIVSEFAADLEFYDLARDDDATRTDPALVVDANLEDVVAADGTGRYGKDDAATPQRLRFVTAKLTMRTEDEDPSVRFVPRVGLHGPLDTYEVDPVMTGAARTVTLAVRVPLRAFLVRNIP